jgi:hypothetical protein
MKYASDSEKPLSRVELQFRGVDDASKPTDVTIRVYRSEVRQVQSTPSPRGLV